MRGIVLTARNQQIVSTVFVATHTLTDLVHFDTFHDHEHINAIYQITMNGDREHELCTRVTKIREDLSASSKITPNVTDRKSKLNSTEFCSPSPIFALSID